MPATDPVRNSRHFALALALVVLAVPAQAAPREASSGPISRGSTREITIRVDRTAQVPAGECVDRTCRRITDALALARRTVRAAAGATEPPEITIDIAPGVYVGTAGPNLDKRYEAMPLLVNVPVKLRGATALGTDEDGRPTKPRSDAAETVLTRAYSSSEMVADAAQLMGSFPFSVVPFVLITGTADGLAADGAHVTGLTLRGGLPHDGHGMAPGLGFFVDRVRDVVIKKNYIENLNDGAYSTLATVRFEGNAHDPGLGPFGGTFGVAAFAGSERFPADVVVRRNRFRNHSHASVLISGAGASDSIWAYTLGEELRDDPEVGSLLPSSMGTEIADSISARVVDNEMTGVHAPAEPGRLADELGAQAARSYTQSGVWLYTTPRRFAHDQATSSIRATVAANEIGGTYRSAIYVWPGPRPGFSPLASRIDLTLANNRLDPTPLANADGDIRLSFLRGGVLQNSTLRVTTDREDEITITHPARHCENGLLASTEIGDCRVLNNRLFVNGELRPPNCPVLHGGSPSCLADEGAATEAGRLSRSAPR